MKVVCLEDKTDGGIALRVTKGGIYDVLNDFVKDGKEYFHLSHAGNSLGVFRKERFRVLEK